MSRLSPMQKSHIADKVATELGGFSSVMETYELEVEEVEAIMLEEGFNRCPLCDQWFPDYELHEAPDQSGDICGDCVE